MAVQSTRSSLSLSLLVHLFFFFALFLAAQRASQTLNPHPTTWIDLEPLKPAEKKAATKIEDSKNQIVQTAPANLVDHAPKDAFLGERNQEADRQTISKQKETVIGAQAQPAPAPAKKATEAIHDLAKLGVPLLPTVDQAKQMAQPAPDVPNWAHPSDSAEDYVKGVVEADRTVLNTKEFVFYGYFQRIRSRLDRAWVPLLREKMARFYQGGRTLASDMDHTTKVMVSLNHLGEITHVKIVDESGTAELDDAAVKAFNLAGPFPNPPRGIIDGNGEIQIPWQFVLKT